MQCGLLENFITIHKNINTINAQLLRKQVAYIQC